MKSMIMFFGSLTLASLLGSFSFAADTPAKQEAMKLKQATAAIVQTAALQNSQPETCYMLGAYTVLSNIEINIVSGSGDEKAIAVATQFAQSIQRMNGYCGASTEANAGAKGDAAALQAEITALIAYLDSVP